MSWIGGVVGMGVGAKAAARKGGIADDFAEAAKAALPFLSENATLLKSWGEADWERFKTQYRPVAEALIADANRAPETEKAAGVVAADSAQSMGEARERLDENLIGRGVNPASGAARSASMKLADARGRTEGIGQAGAKLQANEESTNKKLAALGLSKDGSDAMIAGMGLVSVGGANYGKYAGAIGRDAAKGWGDVGYGIGRAVGSYRPKANPYSDPDADENGLYGTPPQDEMSADNYPTAGYEDGGYADGGLIEGPGTGRSDSIPAVIDGERPARVSNGEYRIAADVAARIGTDRLYSLIDAARG